MAHRHFYGIGMHEFYMPTSKRGKGHGRKRKECKHYNPTTGGCFKIWNKCVGPAICKKFQSNKE